MARKGPAGSRGIFQEDATQGTFAVVGPPFCVRPCLGDGAPGAGIVGQGVWKGRRIVLF